MDNLPPPSPYAEQMKIAEEAETIGKEIRNLEMYIAGIPHGFIPRDQQSRARWDARKKIRAHMRRLDEIRILALQKGWIKAPPPVDPPAEVESEHEH